MASDGITWITKGGKHIPIIDGKPIDKSTNEYMNEKIRNKVKKITKKDVVDGDIYKGADGYWNYDLKNGYLSDYNLPYIWNKTKAGAEQELKMIIQRENIINKRKNKGE